jgi:hypothetical protein
VQSPGEELWEQISVEGEQKYVFYQPPDDIINHERWGVDGYNPVLKDGKQIHYTPLKKPPWLTSGTLIEYEDDYTLWEEVKSFIYTHVELPDIDLYDVLTAWVFYTYIREAYDFAPYIRFYGTKNVGKTRALETLHRLGYRALLTPSVTEAGVFRLVENYSITLLLDETEIYSQDNKQAVQHVLNGGYKRYSYVIRMEPTPLNTYVPRTFDTFGPKAIAGTRLLKDTLESRCVEVIMQRNRRELPLFIDDGWAQRIRSQLLLWRFRRLSDLKQCTKETNVTKVSKVQIGIPPKLKKVRDGRIHELYLTLYSLAVDEDSGNSIVDYALKIYQRGMEEATSSLEGEVVLAITKTRENLESGKFSVQQVCDLLNLERTVNESLGPRTVGRVIKSLGFDPRKMSNSRAGYIYRSSLVLKLCEQYDIPPPLETLETLETSETLEEPYGSFEDRREKTFNKQVECVHGVSENLGEKAGRWD